jgi:predicted aldo/keto reductase-like oxidoreductase
MSNSSNRLNRREFISTTLAGAVSVGLLNRLAPAKDVPGTVPPVSQSLSGNKMTERKLGKTGIVLPVVSMGVMNADNPELVKKSYELGIRHFDTAYGYMRGRNEEMLGKVFTELKCRDKVVITTKIPPPRQRDAQNAKEEFLRMAETSLKRLQTDHVDMIYIHDVGAVENVHPPALTEALAQLKKEGKARFVGFSTHSNMAACLNEAARTGFHDVVLTAFNYAHAENKDLSVALANAAAKGIGLIAMKTQCSQYWYKGDLSTVEQMYYEGAIIQSAVLKWVLRHDFITTAVPGYTTYEQLNEDVSAGLNLSLSSEEKKFLDDRKVKLAMGFYCRQCSQCVSSCPKGADIPAMMRTHMYAACYGNFYQARDTFDGISRERGLETCASCDSCRARCVHRISIAKRIDELKALFG